MAKMAEDPGMEGAPEWITTFVDMISLLVTFFILLFTFSTLEEYQRFPLPRNLLGQRGVMQSEPSQSAVQGPEADLMSALDPESGATDPHARPADALASDDVESEQTGREATDTEREIDLSSRDEILVHFDAEACFAPGETVVSPALRDSLVHLAGVLQHYSHPIVIEGHTDSEFKPSPRYPSAEALSCARAVQAARVFLAASDISPARVRVAGLGSTQPASGNVTARERSQNRRVEVRILPPESARRGN